jgi:hypothetical protein
LRIFNLKRKINHKDIADDELFLDTLGNMTIIKIRQTHPTRPQNVLGPSKLGDVPEDASGSSKLSEWLRLLF